MQPSTSSVSGGRYASLCDYDEPALKAAIDNLQSLGIPTIVASGNDGYKDALGAPACISSTISVGSTDDGSYGTLRDAVSSFSNSADFLDFLAPGQLIESSVPGDRFMGLEVPRWLRHT